VSARAPIVTHWFRRGLDRERYTGNLLTACRQHHDERRDATNVRLVNCEKCIARMDDFDRAARGDRAKS
jgi:hypothetical protein